MNNPDHDKNVCVKDGYGNVTANKQGGNDIRNETEYHGYTIDVGIQAIVWKPNNSWLGKYPSLAAAKAAVDKDILLK